MKSTSIIAALFLQLMQPSYAAVTPCQRDSCYNAIAVQNANNPNLASRRADCRAVLKTVVDDDPKTILTVQTDVETFTQTVTVTTGTVTSPAPVKRTAVPEVGYAMLEGRDKIVVQGSVPKYASACRNLQAYGTACLCFGVKAVVNKGITVTVTRTQTVQTTTISTKNVEATLAPCGPSFNCQLSGTGGGCDGGCVCVRSDKGNRCLSDGQSFGPCTTSADCTNGRACLFDTCFSGGVCANLSNTCKSNVILERMFGQGAGLLGGDMFGGRTF